MLQGRSMKKFYYIIFAIVIIPMVLSSPLETLDIFEEEPIKSNLSLFMKHGRVDNTDENVFQKISYPFLQMKTIKTIAKSIFNIFNGVENPTNETLDKITFNINSVINELNETGINLYDESNIKIVNKIIHLTIREIGEDLKILLTIINNIDYVFKDYYLEYLNGYISNTSLNIFISKAMSLDADSPGKSTAMLEKIVYFDEDGTSNSSFLKIIAYEINKKNSSLCSLRQTPQQLMYNLYHFFATMELKAYIMIVSAYKLHAMTSNDNYTKDFERIHAKHLERMKNYLIIFSAVLNESSTEIGVCSLKSKENYKATQIKMINKLSKESDVHNNKVVTGVRFVIENEVLHLQIEEGKLIPNGQILPGSEQWIPIDDINYANRTINRNGQVTRIRQCTEYHSVTSTDYWYLNDVMAPPNSVVIGANLEVYPSESSSEKIIYLRLKFAKFNITAAQLDVSQEQYSDNLEIFPRNLRSLDLAKNAEYVMLRETQESIYEPGYGTRYRYEVPFINSEAIYSNPRFPLLGIGTFNKQSENIFDEQSARNNTILLKGFGLNFSSLIDIN